MDWRWSFDHVVLTRPKRLLACMRKEMWICIKLIIYCQPRDKLRRNSQTEDTAPSYERHQQTFNDERYIVCYCRQFFRRHLTAVDTGIMRSYFSNRKSPFAPAVDMFNAESWVGREPFESNEKRMSFRVATPRHLVVTQWNGSLQLSFAARSASMACDVGFMFKTYRVIEGLHDRFNLLRSNFNRKTWPVSFIYWLRFRGRRHKLFHTTLWRQQNLSGTCEMYYQITNGLLLINQSQKANWLGVILHQATRHCRYWFAS